MVGNGIRLDAGSFLQMCRLLLTDIYIKILPIRFQQNNWCVGRNLFAFLNKHLQHLAILWRTQDQTLLLYLQFLQGYLQRFFLCLQFGNIKPLIFQTAPLLLNLRQYIAAAACHSGKLGQHILLLS